jgi:TolA-binding protein
MTDADIKGYLGGNRCEEWEAHFAGCDDCRARMLDILAGEQPRKGDALHLASVTDRVLLQTGKQARIFRFPIPYRYALAAGIVVAAAAGFLGGLLVSKRERAVADTPPPCVAASTPLVAQAGPAFPPMRLYGPRYATIGARTGYCADNQALIAVREKSAAKVRIQLNRGMTLFEVQKGRFARFEVETPFADIRVTGTVFAVSVDSAYTRVSVLEGSVRIENRRIAARAVDIAAGAEAVMGRDTLMSAASPVRAQLDSLRIALHGFLSAPAAAIADTAAAPAFLPGADSLDRILRRIEIDLITGDPAAAAAAEAFVAQNPHSRRSDRLLYVRGQFLEAADSIAAAITAYQRISIDSMDLYENALYRIGRLYEISGDRARARATFRDYLALFPNGIWAEPATYRCIAMAADKREVIDLMREYVAKFGSSTNAEEIMISLADLLRTRVQDYKQAMRYYDLFQEAFPQSRHRADALYWAGWCLVRQGVDSADNRFFRMHLRDYPDEKLPPVSAVR